ncbi:YlxR family protein [bacterium BFN5]|nr:YlxR family protein [bacterium BFN5]
MCVGCQQMKNKKELMRIVRTPEGAIVLDSTGKKAGRGAYVCRDEQCFAKAFKEKRLEKALKHAVDTDVYDQLRIGITNP